MKISFVVKIFLWDCTDLHNALRWLPFSITWWQSPSFAVLPNLHVVPFSVVFNIQKNKVKQKCFMRSGVKLALGSTSENLSRAFLPAWDFFSSVHSCFLKPLGEIQHRNSFKFRYPKNLVESLRQKLKFYLLRRRLKFHLRPLCSGTGMECGNLVLFSCVGVSAILVRAGIYFKAINIL